MMEKYLEEPKKFRVIEIEKNGNHDIYDFVLNKKLVSLNCKHIMTVNSLTQEVYNLADKAFEAVGAFNRMPWGARRNGTLQSEMEIIKGMVNSEFMRPMRVVIDKQDRIWADNTHTAVSWVLRKGVDCKLIDVPFYIVDLRVETKVISVDGSLSNDLNDVKGAIKASSRITNLIEHGYRPNSIKWRVGDLMLNIGIVPCLHLASMSSWYRKYPMYSKVWLIMARNESDFNHTKEHLESDKMCEVMDDYSLEYQERVQRMFMNVEEYEEHRVNGMMVLACGTGRISMKDIEEAITKSGLGVDI